MSGRLAILDWGIGGLSVLKALLRRNPSLDFIYLSDSGSTPYGKMTPLELRNRIETLFQVSMDRFQADAFVIACNAASTLFMDTGFRMGSKPVYNVIRPTIEFLLRSDYKCIGVIGGKRTIDARVYSKGVPNCKVIEGVAQPLSALIESGQVTGKELEQCLRDILNPFDREPIEALVLACTHYPAVSGEISRILTDIELIDPAVIMAEVFPVNKRSIERSPHQGIFYSTGDCEQMRKSAHLAFQMEISDVNEIKI